MNYFKTFFKPIEVFIMKIYSKHQIKFSLFSLFTVLQIVLATSSFAILPKAEYIANPDSLHLGIQWKDTQINTPNAINIAVRIWEPFVKNEKNTTNIIVAGGDYGNLSYYNLHVAALCVVGYRVIQFDYRGFGKSSFVDLDFEYLYFESFVLDFKAVVDWSKQTYKPQKTGVLGFSMGSIIAQAYLVKNRLDFAIFDGLIINPVIVGNRIMNADKERTVLVPKEGYDFQRKLRKIKTPILVFAGKEDQLTYINEVEKYIRQRRKKRTVIFYEGKHNEGFKKMTKNAFGDLAVAEINSFWDKL